MNIIVGKRRLLDIKSDLKAIEQQLLAVQLECCGTDLDTLFELLRLASAELTMQMQSSMRPEVDTVMQRN